MKIKIHFFDAKPCKTSCRSRMCSQFNNSLSCTLENGRNYEPGSMLNVDLKNNMCINAFEALPGKNSKYFFVNFNLFMIK